MLIWLVACTVLFVIYLCWVKFVLGCVLCLISVFELIVAFVYALLWFGGLVCCGWV